MIEPPLRRRIQFAWSDHHVVIAGRVGVLEDQHLVAIVNECAGDVANNIMRDDSAVNGGAGACIAQLRTARRHDQALVIQRLQSLLRLAQGAAGGDDHLHARVPHHMNRPLVAWRNAADAVQQGAVEIDHQQVVASTHCGWHGRLMRD